MVVAGIPVISWPSAFASASTSTMNAKSTSPLVPEDNGAARPLTSDPNQNQNPNSAEDLSVPEVNAHPSSSELASATLIGAEYGLVTSCSTCRRVTSASWPASPASGSLLQPPASNGAGRKPPASTWVMEWAVTCRVCSPPSMASWQNKASRSNRQHVPSLSYSLQRRVVLVEEYPGRPHESCVNGWDLL